MTKNKSFSFSLIISLTFLISFLIGCNTPAVTGITLNQSNLAMQVGNTNQLIATIEPSNAQNQSVVWLTSDPNVATFSTATNSLSNNITAVGTGTTTITVKTNDGNFTATCVVTVADCNVALTGLDTNPGTVLAPKRHIQACINSSTQDGDVIQVMPGTYVENLNFLPTAGVTLIGSPSDPTLTVIDGNQLNSVIKIQGQLPPSPVKNYVIKGFTIQNGQNGNQQSGFGGGIYSQYASLRLEDLIIQNNIAGSGAGLFIYNDRTIPTVPTSNPDIYLDNVSLVSNYGGNGKALFITSSKQVTIKHSKVLLNTHVPGSTSYTGGSVALLLANENVLIENSLFALNEVLIYCFTKQGIGLDIEETVSSAVIVNTTVANNVISGGGHGAGILVKNSNLILLNSIIWGNSASGVNSQVWPIYQDTGASTVRIDNSDIQGGQTAIPASTNNIVYWLGGNISSDPLFINPSSWQTGGFSIQSSSPALDTGVAQTTIAGTTYTAPNDDIDGNPRPVGAAPDMGAYEQQKVSATPNPPAPKEAKPIGNIVRP